MEVNNVTRRQNRVLLGIVLLIVMFLYTGNNWLQVSRCEVELTGLPEAFAGFKIVHLSDLHGKQFGRDMGPLVKAIDRIDPDIILCSGDMLNSRGDEGKAFLRLLKELNRRYPVYYSLGNHEYSALQHSLKKGTNLYQNYIDQVQKYGVIILDNQKTEIFKDGESMLLYGFASRLNHYISKETFEWKDSELTSAMVGKEIGKSAPDQVNLFLAHNPKWIDAYAQWGADLVLSGHVHGGIIRLPLLGGLLSPDLTFFPPYDAGLYKKHNTIMHVSRGLGRAAIPFRICNRPDLTVITLKGVRQ